MSDRKWFTPAPGLKIVDPTTREVVPESGKWVFASDEYYMRRELDGGGTLSAAPPAGAAEE